MARELVQLLGRPEVYLDEQRTLLTANQVDRFLAYLAYRGTWVSREELTFLFWPDQPDSAARRNLRKVLHRARQQIDRIESEGDLLRWLVPTDVEAWKKALAEGNWEVIVRLYRGQLCQGLDSGAGSGFADWLERERAGLHGSWRDTAIREAEALAQDRPGEGADLLQHFLMADPLDSDVVMLCLRLLAAAGRRSDLELLYHRHSEQLEIELGLPPPEELLVLRRQLLAAEEQPSGAAPDDPEIAAVHRPAAAPWNVASFVGRSNELERLAERLAEALAGQGGAVVVEGEAGVGKTKLIEEFLARSRPVQLYSGRCVERELGTPLEPIRSALRDLVGSDLARLVDGTRFWTADPHDRSTIHQGLTAQLIRSARSDRGAVLFIDDLQWGDAATLEFLSYAAKRVHGEPVLILASYRSEDRSVLESWLDHLAERRALVRIRLGRLGLRHIRELLGDMVEMPPADLERLAAFIHQESEGNPLYVREYLRWLHDSAVLELDAERRIRGVRYERIDRSALPEGVRALVWARYQALDDTAQAALRLAAVIGRTFDFGLLEAASTAEPIPLWSTVEPLLASELIVEASGEQYTFSHDKMRQTVYESIGPPVRRALHAQVAEVLRERGAAHTELVHHTLRARLWPASFEHLDSVARTAEKEHSWEVALQAYTRILDIVDRLPDADRKRFGALQGLERLLEFMDRRAERAAVVEQMTALAERIDDPGLEAEAHLKRMAVLIQQGDRTEAEEARLLALRLFAHLGDAAGEARVYRELGYATWSRGDYSGALEASLASIDIYRRLGNRRAEAAVSQNIARAHRWLGNHEGALEWSGRAADIYGELGDPLGAFLRLDGFAYVAMERNDLQAAIPLIEQLLPICKQLGDKHLQLEKHMNLARCLLGTGAPERALRHFQAAARLGAEIGDPRHESFPLMSAGAICERLGRSQEAAESYRRAARLLGTAYAVTGVIDEQLARGDALTLLAGVLERDLDQGDEALEAFDEAEAIYRRHGDLLRHSRLAMERAAAYRRADWLEAAESDYRTAVELSRKAGARAREAAALASLGVVRRERGDLAHSIEVTREALECLEGLGDRQAEAYLLASLAESLRRSGRTGDARSALERSLALREDLGDHEGARRVRQILSEIEAQTSGTA